MTETISQIDQTSQFVQWVQRSYIAVPGSVCVSSKDLYEKYSLHHQDTELISKKAMGQIVPLLFVDVKVVHVNGPNRYRGLRPSFDSNRVLHVHELTDLATTYGYIKMKDTPSTVTYSCYSGYIVNKHEHMKSVTINVETRGVQILLDGRNVSTDDICLGNVKIKTAADARIVFNTVKQCKVCCGKSVESKLNTTKNSLVQEWFVPGNENVQLRATSKNCKGVSSFTSYCNVCNVCKNQAIPGDHDKLPEACCLNPDQIFESFFPMASELTLKILKAQSDICKSADSNKDPRSRRWDNEIIQICLSLWNRSPQTYSSLRDSGLFYLPSSNLLQRYKNCLSQSPGLNDNMLLWMCKEAERMNIDKRGGLILDEMAVQDDLKMSFSDGKNLVDGLVDLGQLAKDMNFLNTKQNEIKLATHVLQFMFLSYDGFRFPFAYFPSVGANAPELYVTVWEAISKLLGYEFEIDYVCIDGASNNRSLQMMHFEDKDDAKVNNYSAANPYGTPTTVTFIMDYSHNIKKLRNNIYSSRDSDGENCKKHLKIDNKCILWDHWIKAFHWDKLNNPVRVHQKLTNDHMFMSKSAKMRNHLAEEALNTDMLYLMQQYQQSLADGSHLDKTIELLQLTSKVIELFRDRRPISDMSDPRLECLSELEVWLDQWLENVNKITDKTASERNKMFISKETYSDVSSMCRGFTEICKRRIQIHQRSVVPAGLNSDVIENFFCQQRTLCNGSNNNPTVHQYKYGINATILGQSAVSKKSNAYNKRKSVQPFNIVLPAPLNKKKCIRL